MVKQVVPHPLFPSGDYRDLAEVRLNPTELAARYGVRFEQRLDDLDSFELAAIVLADGSQAWLLKYRGDQFSGTLVRVDANGDLSNAKAMLAHALDLGEADFAWVAPGVGATAAAV